MSNKMTKWPMIWCKHILYLHYSPLLSTGPTRPSEPPDPLNHRTLSYRSTSDNRTASTEQDQTPSLAGPKLAWLLTVRRHLAVTWGGSLCHSYSPNLESRISNPESRISMNYWLTAVMTNGIFCCLLGENIWQIIAEYWCEVAVLSAFLSESYTWMLQEL